MERERGRKVERGNDREREKEKDKERDRHLMESVYILKKFLSFFKFIV